MSSNIGIIIAREFRERVVKKSFILTTLLTPLLMVVMMIAPTLIMELSQPSEERIAVIDNNGTFYKKLTAKDLSIDNVTFELCNSSLSNALENEKYDAVLTIPSDVYENPQNITLYKHEAGSMVLESDINSSIKQIVEKERLKGYKIDNLEEILEKVKVTSQIKTKRIDEDGNDKDVSSTMSFIIGLIISLILYMFLIMYGQMVMTSIIEEKNNRVLELVVSSVKPLHLMLGKIIGVGLVAVVQIIIWALMICLVSGVVMPLLLPEGMTEQIALMNSGQFDSSVAEYDTDMIQAMATLTSVGYIAKLFLYLSLFLVGGFLFYASIFAAIGSAVDNVQDASQLQTFALLPILVALMFSFSVGNDPSSTAAVWLSMIPFTSPMVMLARIPFEIESWQIWVSLVILYASFVGMAWIAAKIYRVGIFMYGKKPGIKDLIRWARYK